MRVLGDGGRIPPFARFQILPVQGEPLHHACDVEGVLSDSVEAIFVLSGGDELLLD